MTDRVYPSSKPTTTGAAPGGTTAPAAAPAKSHLYNPTRPTYRPQAHRRRPRRSCRSICCCCFFWFLLVLLLLILLAATAGAALWVFYRPHSPTFSVSTFKTTQFNLSASSADASSSGHLSAAFNLTVAARNPNKKITIFYDPFTVSISSNDVILANGSYPAFASSPKDFTVLKPTLSSHSRDLDADSVTSLRSDLKKKSGLPLEFQMDTKVKIKMGGFKSSKVGIRVTCDGIQAAVPKGKSPSVASTSDSKCEVDLRIKIWKWTF